MYDNTPTTEEEYAAAVAALLPPAILAALPPLCAQDGKGEDAIVHVKLFLTGGNWTWYGTEYDPDPAERRMFGLVVGHDTELGYWSMDELVSVRSRPLGLGVERDLYFRPTTMGAVREALRNDGVA